MANPLTMKLEQYTRFDPAERETLDRLLSYPRRTWARGETIIADGHKVGNIYLIVTGLAARSKSLLDGNRQLMALLVPGDLCDVEVFVLEAMDHDIVAVSDTTCALLPSKVVEDLLTEHSNITKALWWSTMTDSAVLRQWIVGHGSRDARERLAHLFCELLIRYRIVGETTNETFAFPLTQDDLADATGMTTVHVNRVLKQLRAEGLIELKDKALTILDPERLKSVAQFQANYLHLARTEQGDREVSKRAGDLVPPPHGRVSHESIAKVKGSLETSQD